MCGKVQKFLNVIAGGIMYFLLVFKQLTMNVGLTLAGVVRSS
jgi:hypothetical protein